MSRSAHRRPPRPPHYYSAKRGWCRVCGEPIIEDGVLNSRKNWHHLCAVRWKIMNQPTETRRFVFKRDNGRCARCSVITTDWEADHVIPLRYATKPEHWQLGNLQTLCHKHHVEKTALDRCLYND